MGLGNVMLLLSICALPTSAQPLPISLWAKGDSIGIRLVWTLPLARGLLPDAYGILRRESRKNVYEALATVRRPPRERWALYMPTDVSADTMEILLQAAADPTHPDSLRRKLLKLLQEMLLDDFPNLAPIFGTVYHDTTAQRGRRYDYALTVGDSVVAEVQNVLAGIPELPTPPMNVRGKAADSLRIQLLWDFKGGSARGIWGYHVWRQAPGDTGFIRHTEHPVVTLWLDETLPMEYLYQDAESLQKEASYRYRVSAVDVFGREGPWSDAVEVIARDVRPIAPPHAVVARPEADSILISWKPPSDTRVAGYHVYRWPLGTDTARMRLTAHPLPASVHTFVDRPGELPTEHVIYAVSSLSEEGEESQLALSRAVPVPDLTPPPPPRFVMGYGEGRRAVLRWTRSMATDLRGYEVARALSPTAPLTLVTSSLLEDTTFTDVLTSEAGRTAFWYRVRAVDRRGNRSDWTPAVLVLLPDIVPPPAPRLTEVAAEDGAIRLRWQIDAAADLLGFWLNRYEDTTQAPITLHGGDPLPAHLREFRDSLIEPGQTYWYELVAIDSAFNPSLPSNRVAGQAYSSQPQPAPAIDSLYATTEGVVIVWQIPQQRNATIVVERSTDGKRFVPISPLLPLEQGHFVDRAVRPQQHYFYRLRLRSSQTGNWSPPSAAAAISP